MSAVIHKLGGNLLKEREITSEQADQIYKLGVTNRRQKELIKKHEKTIDELKKEITRLELKQSSLTQQVEKLKWETDRSWRIIKDLNATNQEYKHAVRQANKALSSLVG